MKLVNTIQRYMLDIVDRLSGRKAISEYVKNYAQMTNKSVYDKYVFLSTIIELSFIHERSIFTNKRYRTVNRLRLSIALGELSKLRENNEEVLNRYSKIKIGDNVWH